MKSILRIVVPCAILIIATAFAFQNCSPTRLSKNISSAASTAVDNSSQIVVPNFAATSFPVDQTASDCTDPLLSGWKCLETTVTSAEGLNYKISINYSRPLVSSKGTMLMAVGGDGKGNSRGDPPSKQMMDELSESDQIRVIQISFDDMPSAAPPYGGYWTHAGGYKSAGAAFYAALQYIIKKQIVVGDFLNFLGGSNGSMVAAYAMSHFGADKYFNRVVFQMGPFLPDIRNACSANSSSSFTLNTAESVDSIFSLLTAWVGNSRTAICDPNADDRLSVLRGSSANYPNTHVHTIMGADEVTRGFGLWILASNLEWFNGITSKSKTRWVRAGIAHNNMYQDMRRLLKLAPNESPSDEPNCLTPVCPVVSPPVVEKKITYSVNGVLRNGIFTQGEILQGRVEGYAENDTYSCMEIVGASSCSETPYTKFPNDDWKFSNGAWVATIDSGRFPPNIYKGYVTNSAGETRTFNIELRKP